MVPSSCVKDKLPSIENPPTPVGAVAVLSTHANTLTFTAACAILPDGSVSDSLNGNHGCKTAALFGWWDTNC
ncbi:hypothetical protein Nepgr_029734 [Nepenthes gracilis]|uniref:Uncharacterized protein n=1 Tax=Nepenthes gracilis TaxID=150966 RepID=A0AAD3TFK9_NEPGR|nr:hypothetical protein Nepgr_029734 [Nepenthes gracilis]